ncbi:glycosyltransferase [Amycolatopsis saalfeldensis]|uniref:Glycosyltransferase like family 2 n=1 Tax=Amycolatopsis saalfeldensis TaxID=394193 RepID=A0A1H8XCK2_9PSEU|nr:glycosyltransferase family 2 protein [Amycolatopsis saalfeldensis]SEP37539.1 Glycosyltransferase like family 2 [Amycolatopsis saalfeldensis]
MITAIAVVVPARDEAPAISGCLHAIRRSLLRLPVSVERAVIVVADRCADDTASRARSLAEVIVSRAPLTIGEVRDLGCRTTLSRLAGHRTSEVLLLNTDADSEVDQHWAARHLARARQGGHATTGPAHLIGPAPGGPGAAARYRRLVETADREAGNVYGANLAVRADTYDAVGGFGRVASGEDHSLWNRLENAGYRLGQEPGASVRTSARLDGRAPGGLSSLLRKLASGR